MRTAAVILAAGLSTRFGSPKQAVRIGGRSMLDMVAGTAREVGLDPVLAVVPPGHTVPEGVTPLTNPHPAAGISRSLRLGLAAVPEDADAAMILLGDEPLLSANSLLEILVAAEGGGSVVASRAGNRLGPPVCLRRERFDLAEGATGDSGLGRLLREAPDLVTVTLDRAPADVDTPADLDAVAPACPGCGARLVPPEGTAAHPYIGASPGCWLRWTELHGGGLVRLGRQGNDAYAAQHPGVDERRARQSVAVHLTALCHWLEHGIVDPHLTELTRALLEGRPDWPWLTPPERYALTIHDLPIPAEPDDTRRWIEAVWEAWSPHHETVRRWAAGTVR
jgi:CTP:molybdopterin cytidylyltransferase MocA